MFKFTIREAILMTTIVAILLMWWLEKGRNVNHEARLTAIEMRLQSFPIPVLPPSRFVMTPGATVPAPPTKSQFSSARWTVIPKDAAPVIPGPPPQTSQPIPRIETLQKSIQDSN